MDVNARPSFRFFGAMDRVRRAWGEVVPCPQLSKSQFGTLLTLCLGGKPGQHMKNWEGRDPYTPMTLSELAAIMEQSMPAVSQRITRLEGMGYVERKQDEKDKRTTWIRVTPLGLELLEGARQSVVRRMKTLMEALGEEDAETVFRILDKLATALEEGNRAEQSASAHPAGHALNGQSDSK